MNSFDELYQDIDYDENELKQAVSEIHSDGFFPNDELRAQSMIDYMANPEEFFIIVKEIIVYASLAMNVMHKNIFEQLIVQFNLSQCINKKHYAISLIYYMKEHPEYTLSGTIPFSNLNYYYKRLDDLIDRITMLSSNAF